MDDSTNGLGESDSPEETSPPEGSASPHSAPDSEHADATAAPDKEKTPGQGSASASSSPLRMLGIERLIPVTRKDWGAIDQENRMLLRDQYEEYYWGVLRGFEELADKHVDKFLGFSAKNEQWRRNMIWATGGVAILNLLVAFEWSGSTAGGDEGITKVLSLIAAIYAALLVIFSNLENFWNYADRAKVHREARELLLDAAREFTFLWHVYVLPFGSRPEAYENAEILYHQITARDKEVRGKIAAMTTTKEKGKDKKG